MKDMLHLGYNKPRVGKIVCEIILLFPDIVTKTSYRFRTFVAQKMNQYGEDMYFSR